MKHFGKLSNRFKLKKGVNNEKITLVENDEIISNNDEIAETLNNFFINVIRNLNIPQYEDPTTDADNIVDPVFKAIEKFKTHSSIKLISSKYNTKYQSGY